MLSLFLFSFLLIMRTQVAYLGPKGTYAEKAADILSKLANYESPIFVPCKGLHSVIKSLAYKNCDAAVVPIENSVEGGVTSTLDALWKFPDLYINKAIVLPIKHALISSGKITNISEVLSHPQALAQCSEWLASNLPEAILLPTNSTSEAVNMVKGSSFRAAIGSKSLVEIEGLKELAFPINDVPGNRTRFVLLTQKTMETEAVTTGESSPATTETTSTKTATDTNPNKTTTSLSSSTTAPTCRANSSRTTRSC